MMELAIPKDKVAHHPWFVATAAPLEPSDAMQLSRMLDGVCSRFPDAQALEFLDAAPLIASELPYALRAFFHRARLSGAAIMSLRAAEFIGPLDAATPSDWKNVKHPSPAHRAEVLLVLLASLVGEVFGWATQQNGRYVHDVLPMRGLENEQVGWSSKTPLTWHTEDAFHPHRADYLGLLCLRNPSRVATTVCSVADLQLDDDDIEVLWEPRYLIRPDDSHRPKYNSTDAKTFLRIQRMFDDPERVSVLFGQRAAPFLRIDPDYMAAIDGDAAAARALAAISREIERTLVDMVLQPGDLVLMDNYRIVHGRRSFVAAYDGNDRWLKRVNVKRDLRPASASIIPGTRLMT